MQIVLKAKGFDMTQFIQFVKWRDNAVFRLIHTGFLVFFALHCNGITASGGRCINNKPIVGLIFGLNLFLFDLNGLIFLVGKFHTLRCLIFI